MFIKNKFFLYIFLILFFLLSFLFWKNENFLPTQSFNKKEIYTVKRVIDGDTFIIQTKQGQKRVRIIGMNSPESQNVNNRQIECFGKEASKQARKILQNKKIILEFDDSQSRYDKYGRILGHIFLADSGENFAKKMIADGFAYEYTYHGLKYKYQSEYRQAEKNARKNKLGLWGDACTNF